MTPFRVLVVRLGAMGDILHTLPAVASLKQSYPQSHIAWAVEEKWAPLLQGNPFVDEQIFVDRRNLKSILKLRHRLRSTKWDLAVDFQGLVKSALVAACAKPERIAGYHRSEAREPLAALFYSTTVLPQAVHVVDRHLELAASAGAVHTVRTFPIPQGRPEGDLPAGPFVLANPVAGWPSKQWPIGRYAELGKRLLSEFGLTLLFNVASRLPIPDVRQHVSGLEGLIHATRQATAVLGVDSGPMHLAAALAKPGVALFGPTNPERNGPYGSTITVLRDSQARTTYKRRSEVDESMNAIGVDHVLAALKERLLCPAV